MKREKHHVLLWNRKGTIFHICRLLCQILSFFCNIYVLISPFENVVEGHIAVVGIELQEEGWIEGVCVPDETEHSHGHLSQQRPGDIYADVQQVLDADSHTILS